VFIINALNNTRFKKEQVFIAGRKDERKLTHHIRREREDKVVPFKLIEVLNLYVWVAENKTQIYC